MNKEKSHYMKIKYFGFALLSLLAGCDKPELPSSPPRPALVMVVGTPAEEANISLVGEVLPRYESNQGFRIDGKIIERKVDVGATVKKGQVLALLDPADTDLRLSAAQADVRTAEANLTLATAELARYRQLFTKKFVSASALDVKEAELKTAKAGLAQAQAQADVSANQSQYNHLRADRDGVVTMINAEPGQVVQAGEVVVKIADTQAIEVLVAVPESHREEVKLDTEAKIKLWADPKKIYAGRIREIAPSADPTTRTFNVRVALQEPDDTVKLGMTARVRFNPQDELRDIGFLIPSTALTEINGNKTVWVIDTDNKAQPRPVVAGQFGELGVMVTDGLQAGEKIAIAGVHTLVKGQAVKPMVEATP
jgi:membrane fusion protein, multidrug efflux system